MTLIGCFTKNNQLFYLLSDGTVMQEINRGNEVIFVASKDKIPLSPTHELKEVEVETGEILRRDKGEVVEFITTADKITAAIPGKNECFVEGSDKMLYRVSTAKTHLARAGHRSRDTITMLEIYKLKGILTEEYKKTEKRTGYFPIGK